MVFAVGYAATVSDARTWRNQYLLTYPVLSDLNIEVTPLFCPDIQPPLGIYMLPHSCIIDDDQILQWTHAGYEIGVTIAEFDSIVNALFDPEIAASANAIEFPDVEMGTTAQVDIYLDNTGTGTLDITEASVSGAPYSVIFTPGSVVSVNDSLLVTVEFSPEGPGPYDDMLTINSSAGDLQIPITGTVGINNLPGNEIPLDFSLNGNYPNPFNAETIIEFSLPSRAEVTLEIYSTLGKHISTVGPIEYSQGIHSVKFNAADLPAGVYFYRLQAGYFSAVEKMILLK